MYDAKADVPSVTGAEVGSLMLKSILSQPIKEQRSP